MLKCLYAAFAALCLIANLSVAWAAEGDSQPVILESISRATEDQHLAQSWTLSVPTQQKADAWIFTFDNKERWGAGYRTKLFGGKAVKWQRLILSANDFEQDWQIQVQTLAATKDFSGLLSLQAAEGKKLQIFTDPQFRVASDGDLSLWLQTQYFGELGDLTDTSKWRVGPELQYKLKSITLKGRCTFGSGDPQYQLWVVAPIGK